MNTLQSSLTEQELRKVVVDCLVEATQAEDELMKPNNESVTARTLLDTFDITRADLLHFSMVLKDKTGIQLNERDGLAALFKHAPSFVVENAKAAGFFENSDLNEDGSVKGAAESTVDVDRDSRAVTVGRLQEYVIAAAKRTSDTQAA